MKNELWHISGPDSFNDLALQLFHHQLSVCTPYRRFCEALNCTSVKTADEIPYLPISAFKTHEVRSTEAAVTHVFESSGTTEGTTSKHLVSDIAIYEESFVRHFEAQYGPCSEICILGLLPSYLERSNSSLVHMVDALMKRSGHPLNGFYLDEQSALVSRLGELKKSRQKTLLIGVSFALLDMAQHSPIQFPELIVMETGGMKGRGKELIREELHARLKAGFGVAKIHSEYGMTELLSQAYSAGDGRFHCPPWMRASIRETDDPLQSARLGKTGGINIIDLANIESCAFIATDDLGRLHADGSFEVLGRFDRSDVRGCNLMVV